VAAELEHADLERHPRARGRLLEDQRDGAARQRARGQRVGLELARALKQGSQLGLGQLATGEEVTGQARQPIAAA
jgi:hypothetical protein